jgi:hypothetical protein
MAINNPVGSDNNYIINDITAITNDYNNFLYTYTFNAILNSSTGTAKKGILVDSGNTTNNYSPNQVYYFYLAPLNVTTFFVSVQQFKSENEIDYLRIYKADNIASLNSPITINTDPPATTKGTITTPGFTSLLTLTGDVPAANYTYSTNNLVFTWFSDSAIEDAGFKIRWDAYPDTDYAGTNYVETQTSLPLLFTIDGPLSLKGTGKPYTVYASKIKER